MPFRIADSPVPVEFPGSQHGKVTSAGDASHFAPLSEKEEEEKIPHASAHQKSPSSLQLEVEEEDSKLDDGSV